MSLSHEIEIDDDAGGRARIGTADLSLPKTLSGNRSDYTRLKFPVLAIKFPVPLQKFPVPMSREFRSKSKKSLRVSGPLSRDLA